ncbi:MULTISPECIES: FadR/GntR family transcriptional regulator [unclassified Sinorhizobium]|uniref:FadR/GntR family transcriptional regulator n=1 Tax=unclassified Sinorhizobium TaxID=2613772 RepID=UPI0024C21F31|nr:MULTISPECIES: FadR/GntR family transcriptional regulator [unclassified Sinorhizobium]MDK1373671.1 FadR/GntR family transcriptional regulator [Sinorhizobium sp. 6-70]MDK1477768.1 FadR/GntR family transcriptional regulator [Sinorhizobium sp. 6-117]
MSEKLPTTPSSGDLVAGAVSQISAFIRKNQLKPGDRLPSEAALTESLNVSRTVVREALRSLAAMRLIDLGAGKRPTVAELDDSSIAMTFRHGLFTDQIDIRQIYDARRTIEGRTATLAALLRTEKEADEMLGFARAMQNRLDQPAVVMENDLALHLAIARASKNPVFALMIGAFQGVIVESWPIGWRARATDDEREAMNRLHLDLAEAIAASDPQAASTIMDRHFDQSLRALARAGLT